MAMTDKLDIVKQWRWDYFRSRKFGVQLIIGLCLFVLGWINFEIFDSLTCFCVGVNSRWHNFFLERRHKHLTFAEDTVRRKEGNGSCTIIGCTTAGSSGADTFWDHYSKSEYSIALTTFKHVMMNGKAVDSGWCRIPAALNELKRNRHSRVVYANTNVRLGDVSVWCNMPHLGKDAPIIMTSLYRERKYETDDYTVAGSQVQSNAFVVTPGRHGVNALLKWQDLYAEVPYGEQGVIHMEEQGLCGVPGWINCYRFPS